MGEPKKEATKTANRIDFKTSGKKKSEFDSYAEELFYEQDIRPLMLVKIVMQCQIHREFEILPEIRLGKVICKAKRYTPDFILEYADGRTEVIEIKGKKIKRLQRDYELRKHLFIERFCIPNHWEFRQVAAEDITGGNK